MFLFKLFLMTLLHCSCVAECNLPEFLWQHPENTAAIRNFIERWGPSAVFDGIWRSRMRNPTWDVEFSASDDKFRGAWFWYTADKWNFTKTSLEIETESPRHNLLYNCGTYYGNGKFLLYRRHKDNTEYRCFHFIRHSDYVAQYKLSESNSEPRESLCDDENLAKSDWPLIRIGNWRFQLQTCPLSGGYDATWKLGSQPKPERNQVARIESSCMETEGAHFTFQSENVPSIGYNNSEIMYCLGDWQDGSWTYMVMTVLKYRKRKPTGMWILKYPTSHSNQFTALLMIDLIASPSDPITDNFVEFNMTKRLYRSACEDQSTLCQSVVTGSTDPKCLMDNSWPNMHCRKTCRICSTDRMSSTCLIDNNFIGEWLLHGLDYTDHISITNGSMNIEGFGNFACTELKGFIPGGSTVDYQMNFIAALDNGCSPRYSCIELHQITPDIIQYRVSKSVQWPLSEAEDEPLCSQFSDHELHFGSDNDMDKYYSSKLKILVRNSPTRTAVNCHFPYNTTFKMEYTDGPNCTGTLLQRSCDPEENTLVLKKNGCTGQSEETHTYRCLAALWSTDLSHLAVGVLVTEKIGEPEQLNCWTLGTSTMFLAPAAECTMSHAMQFYLGIKIPIAKLTKLKENRICETEPIGPP